MPVELERLPLGSDQRVIYNSHGTTNAAIAVMNDGQLYDVRFDTTAEQSANLPWIEFAKLDQRLADAPHPRALRMIADALQTDLYTIQQYLGRDSREGVQVSPILGVFDRLQLINQRQCIDSPALISESETHLSALTGAYLAGILRESFSNVELPEDNIDSSQN